MRPPERVILHLDMDAFYAAVEVREEPELAGRPLIIGHRGRRGVVSTCSYEARRFGVHSAMPSVTAMRLCPDAVWRPGRMQLYSEISRKLRRITASYSPCIEWISIDEAFIDLTGIAEGLEAGAEIAARLKAEILERERLAASVGIAPNKFLAKIASDLEKPDGLVLFPIEQVEQKLWPLPVERLWGVGPRTAGRLRNGGVAKVRDLARCSEATLSRLVGPSGAAHLRRLAMGQDDRPLQPRRQPRSISEERTYGEDLGSIDEIDEALLARAEGVARELRRAGLVGKTVQIKVRRGDFTTWTRSQTLIRPTDLAEVLVRIGREIFRERIDLNGGGVRLLGLSVSGLEPAGSGQRSLFVDPAEQRAHQLARAADSVRDKLGESSLVRARLIRNKRRNGKQASSLPSVD